MKITGFIMALALTVSAYAADMGGKWKSMFEGNGQSIEITYDFKVDGSKLTGTVTGPMGETAISEGKIDGNDFTFSMVRGDFKISYKGKIAGEQLNITVQFGENTFEMTAKRAS